MGYKIANDNYLTQKRKAAGYSIRALAKQIQCACSTTGAYFTGFVNPSDDVVYVISQYIGMDYDECRKEFDKTFTAWGKAHADKYEKIGNTTYQIKKSSDKNSQIELTDRLNNPEKVQTKIDMYDVSKYLELLYSKISYEDFAVISGMGITAEDILRYLYGKIDYTLYKELDNLG